MDCFWGGYGEFDVCEVVFGECFGVIEEIIGIVGVDECDDFFGFNFGENGVFFYGDVGCKCWIGGGEIFFVGSVW